MNRGALIAVILMLLVSARAAGSHVLEAESSFVFGRWWYDTYLGSDRVEQAYLPVDLLWRPHRTLRVRLGGDLAWSARKGLAQDFRLDGAGDLRASLEAVVAGGRIRLSAGGATAMRSRALSPGELHVAEALEGVALDLPLARRSDGGRWGLQAAGLVVQSRYAMVHGGVGIEGRRPYSFEKDGREVEPGPVVRLGAGLVAGRASLVHSLDVHLDLPHRSTLEGGGEFEAGSQLRAVWSTSAGAESRRIRADLGVAARAGGSVSEGSPLDASAIRGGNLLRFKVAGVRRMRGWDLEAGLGGVWIRGFPGALGRASWVEPSFGVVRKAGPGRIGAELRLMKGSCREGRDLRGVGVSLCWNGALVP